MEQLMSTGGGWQDQVGGVTPGIKYISSRPGLKQELKVEHVVLPKETMEELNKRFCLIYTGQRRLARNLLRYVVGNYMGGRKESREALEEIERMKTEILNLQGASECPNCGAKMPLGAAFCSSCGTKLENETEHFTGEVVDDEKFDE